MARLRIPGGQLKSYQLREIADVSSHLTSGYVQITTRANLQIRSIESKDCPEVLRRIQSVGLHTRGAGADNVRNLTCNPTAGVDPVELIDCLPYVHELGQFILAHREFYDLPRKFNIAFDGGGLIGAVEDTNDIGAKAVLDDNGFVKFRIALGGATGHKAFARDLGVLVGPEELVKVTISLLRVFLKHGNRKDRKRARLKHLLETWTLADYLAETEKLLGYSLPRVPLSPNSLSYASQEIPHSHIGVHRQKQDDKCYIGIALPAGQITSKQLRRLADLADHFGSGDVRLTVWQNLVIPNIPVVFIESVKRDILRMGLAWKQSNVASGIIACTGNRHCKYAATDTKGHAVELAKFLDNQVTLDEPVNIHFTGCPHSCAQHYMGDIGLLGAKTRDGAEAYHVFLGGGFGKNQAIGRQIFQAMPFEEVKTTIAAMLRHFKMTRHPGETFQAFTTRHDVGQLQEVLAHVEHTR